MNKKSILSLFCVAMLLSSCSIFNKKSNSGSNGSSSSQSSSGGQSSGGGGGGGSSSSGGGVDPIDEKTLEKYMADLKETSQENHLYYHYFRRAQKAKDFNDWDLWVWRYRPQEGPGVRFDWKGRTTSEDMMSATGDAVIDSLGYVVADIDLAGTYKGGWNHETHQMGVVSNVKFMNGTELPEKMGVQIVYSSSRVSDSGFWKNDGGDVKFTLADYALENKDGTTSFHAFVYEDHAFEATNIPVASIDNVDDPFKGDDGTNVTYEKSKYNNVDWTNDKPLQATSSNFLNTAGVGYQIMVASFADSDGDGFGDIYGITQKLDYLNDLGVKVLWLTPIQKSDSYHGYDISDYLAVDSKFGSKVSTAALAAGHVDETTAKADYKELIEAAHSKGMLVVMDLVLNHTSTSNKWFIDSAQLNDSYRGYYQWGNNVTQSENINETRYWYPYGNHVYSYYAKFGSSMPELNYAYTDTRTAVETMAKNWCEFGVDGFRMDAVKHIFLKDEIGYDSNDTYISDTGSGIDYSSDLTKNLNFWRELNWSIKQDYPNAFLVGENFDGHAYHVAPFYEGFDSLFDFYSYFNLTSIASYMLHNGDTGGAPYTGHAATVVGAYNSTATPYSAGSDSDLEGNKTKSIKYGSGWNLAGLFSTYNKYRSGGSDGNAANGYSMINGAFTSNHDIARNVNRVLGTAFDANGLTAQGTVTSENYGLAMEYSTLVEITQLMLPGLTWIYYGDEIGMTGNFGAGQDADSPYSDLCYRQPMKWTSDGVVGDGSMTTGYGISGSNTNVEWDSINSTSLVKSVTEQVATPGSHYNVMKSFANAKNDDEALIKGYYAPYYDDITNEGAKGAVASFTRALGSTSYRVVVNFGSNAQSISSGGEVVASYNGATATNVPGKAAVLIKLGGGGGGGGGITTGFGIVINGDTQVAATKLSALDYQGREQYRIESQSFKAGDTFVLYDFGKSTPFTDAAIDPYSCGGDNDHPTKYQEYFKLVDGQYVVQKDFVADLYIKLKWQDNMLYVQV